MIDRGTLQRLRRQKWDSVDQFAEELYAVLSVPEPATPAAPALDVATAPDQSAPTISRRPATEVEDRPSLPSATPAKPVSLGLAVSPGVAPNIAYQPPVRPEVAVAAPRAREAAASLIRQLPTQAEPQPPRQRPDLGVDYGRDTAGQSPLSRPSPNRLPATPAATRAEPGQTVAPRFPVFTPGVTPEPPTDRSTPETAPVASPLSAADRPVRSVPPAAQADLSAPYANPTPTSDAPAAVRDEQPVAFESAPPIFDRLTGRYEPLRSHIARDPRPHWMGRYSIFAYVQTGAPPGSFGAPGQGTADFYWFDGAQLNLLDQSEGTTIYNLDGYYAPALQFVPTIDINGYTFVQPGLFGVARAIASSGGVTPSDGSGTLAGDGNGYATITYADGTTEKLLVYNSMTIAVAGGADIRLEWERNPTGGRWMCISWDKCVETGTYQ